MSNADLINRLRDYVVNDPYTTELCREAADALEATEARLIAKTGEPVGYDRLRASDVVECGRRM